MRLPLSLILALALAAPALADAVSDVRATEVAFAKAFADRDKAKFFSFVADDATFASARTLRGKQAVIERWSRFFATPEAPFSWTPERVVVTADGMLGLSTGPVVDTDGVHVGDYTSTWRKEKDGAWKIIFDSGGPSPAVLPEHVPPHDEGYVIADDGTRLFYRRIGEGPDTIIAPLDYILYPLLRQFSDRATIITYDLRSRGRSDRPKDPATQTIEQDVRDLESVRAHFKVDKFIPVGYSYLGKMIVMYAAAHPEHVSKLIQLSAAANHDIKGKDEDSFGAIAEEMQKWQEMRAAGAMEKTPKEYCIAQWNVFRHYLTATPKGAQRFDVKTSCEYENEWPLNFMRMYAILGPTIDKAVVSDEDLKKITMPVLTLHGTRDRNVPIEGGREWSRVLANDRFIAIEDAAHETWDDQPAVVFAAIRQFLRGE
ncbi:MAG TPA: alpha/beta fold hydrolase [Thermoanaerobaculia bacterium]|nr:alpha/beta fold hydrolase [Thermoanaerobaculia bacterium]